MNHTFTRRSFLVQSAFAAAASAVLPRALFAEKTRRIRIGYTAITWMNAQVTEAIQDVAQLGFHGFETFGNVLDEW